MSEMDDLASPCVSRGPTEHGCERRELAELGESLIRVEVAGAAIAAKTRMILRYRARAEGVLSAPVTESDGPENRGDHRQDEQPSPQAAEIMRTPQIIDRADVTLRDLFLPGLWFVHGAYIGTIRKRTATHACHAVKISKAMEAGTWTSSQPCSQC